MTHKYIVNRDDFIDLRVALDALIHRLENELKNDHFNVKTYTRKHLEELIELEKRTHYQNMETTNINL